MATPPGMRCVTFRLENGDATSEAPGCQALETAFIGLVGPTKDVLFCHHS